MGVAIASLFTLAIIVAGAALTALLEPRLYGKERERGPAAVVSPRQDVILPNLDRWLYPVAPIVALLGVALASVVIPFGPELIGADLGIGAFYIIVVVDFVVLGLALGGWGANTLHAVEVYYRITAQLVAYVVPLGLAYIGAIMMARSLSTVDIVEAQSGLWFIVLQPIGFALYVVTALMSCSLPGTVRPQHRSRRPLCIRWGQGAAVAHCPRRCPLHRRSHGRCALPGRLAGAAFARSPVDGDQNLCHDGLSDLAGREGAAPERGRDVGAIVEDPDPGRHGQCADRRGHDSIGGRSVMTLGIFAQWTAFVIFTLIAIMGAVGMATTMSMFRSGIFLMASFIGVAALFILLTADLLALLQIMMYIGGMLVMILFMVLFAHDPGGDMMAGMDMAPIEKLFSLGLLPKGSGNGHDAHAGMADMDMAGMEHEQVHQHMDHGAVVQYTCPMHPEIVQDEPGSCPKCGMTLVPREAGAEPAHTHDKAMDMPDMQHGHEHMDHGAVVQYTCPMHPEIVQDEPGSCPKCGMTLVPREAGAEPTHTHDKAMDMPDMQHGHEHMDHGAAVQYTCPMHPEIVQDEPGSCPKCGMTLVPVGMDMAGMDMSMTTPVKRQAVALGVAIGTILVALLLFRPAWPTVAITPDPDSAQQVGTLLLQKYMMAFEGAGLLILLGIFGAVLLGRPDHHPHAGERGTLVAMNVKPSTLDNDQLIPLIADGQDDMKADSPDEVHQHGHTRS